MMRNSPKLLPLLFTGLLAMAAALGAAEVPRDAALGSDGAVYLVHSGSCSELFDDCAEADAGNPVLAVDVLRPGEPDRRLLVPETEGPQAEGAPVLIFEDSSGYPFLVWESKLQPTQSRVNLVWLDGESFSEVVEVSGDVAPLKGPPLVRLTRDSFLFGGEEHDRTVLHVTWWEEGSGSEAVFYTPIVVMDGTYLGSNPVIDLSLLDPAPAPEQPAGLPPSLVRSPTVDVGRDEGTVVIGFVNPQSEKLLAFEVQVLAGELGALAQETTAEMQAAASLYRPEDLPLLADRVGMHIVEVGARFHPALLDFLAAEASRLILDSGATPALQGLANRVGMHIVEVGARGLFDDAGALAEEILLLLPHPSAASLPDLPHYLRLRLVDERPAPQVGDGASWIFLSEDARRAVVSWEQAGELLYRETDGAGGWTEVHTLELTGPIDAARAEQILRQRVREH